MRLRPALAMVIPVLALALAACGSTPDSDIPTAGGGSASPGATPTLSSEESRLKFTQCTREQGIDVPDPGSTFGPEDNAVDKEKLNAATEACRQFMPSGGEEERQKPSAEQTEQLRKFAQCMRENGIANFPDPSADGGINIGGTGLDPEDASFKAAQEACKDLTPQAPGSGS